MILTYHSEASESSNGFVTDSDVSESSSSSWDLAHPLLLEHVNLDLGLRKPKRENT